jgi:hypothetical protein
MSLTAEDFLAELMPRWAIQDFCRALRWAAKAEGYGIEAMRLRGGCVKFSLIPPPGNHPPARIKTRARLHRLFKRAGFRVPDRQLWLRIGRRRRALAIIAAPTIS